MTVHPALVPTSADDLLVRLGELASDDAERSALRARVIEEYLPLAAALARRYAGRGESADDLTQVAVIGLIGAVDRFDAARGVPFAGYATPTILGGIKRYFRDLTWSVRVPRRLQELRMHVITSTEELSQSLRRSPTIDEVAARLDVSADDVRAARVSANAYRPISFEQAATGPTLTVLDTLGEVDPGIEAADWHSALRLALHDLPKRDQRIIALRFFGDMPQNQIAAEIGVSQMHVSRLLTHALARLRTSLLNNGEAQAPSRSDGGKGSVSPGRPAPDLALPPGGPGINVTTPQARPAEA